MEEGSLQDCLALLAAQFSGVLATHSAALPGYPFGSRVRYCLDHAHRPLLVVSRLAQHTRNLALDPRVSLAVWDPAPVDVQAGARLTLLGEVVRSNDDPAARGRYERHFPDSRHYLDALDFDLYRLQPRRVHFIAGFARVQWLEGAALGALPALGAEGEARALRALGHGPPGQAAGARGGHEVAGVDRYGCDLRRGDELARVRFPRPLSDPAEVAALLRAGSA